LFCVATLKPPLSLLNDAHYITSELLKRFDVEELGGGGDQGVILCTEYSIGIVWICTTVIGQGEDPVQLRFDPAVAFYTAKNEKVVFCRTIQN
jgi:hypothetical protein